jgi:PEP-CTERM motif
VALLACGLVTPPAQGDILFITGPTDPAEENVLFNLPGLVQTGNPVQGITEHTGFVLNFNRPGSVLSLTTVSPGEPRITIPGFMFNSLRFEFDDSLVSFTELDFAVTANQSGSITFTAVTTDGQVFTGTSSLNPLALNPFSVVATGGERLRELSYASPAPFTVDVRQVRVGGVVTVSEPSTLTLLGLGSVALVGCWRRRRTT